MNKSSLKGLYKYSLLFVLIIFSSFETGAQIVAPPTLVSPENGSANLSMPVTLSWNHPSASTYRIQVATDVSFTNIVTDVNAITSKSYQLNGLADDTYYWRVKAFLLLVESEWSEIWNFGVLNIPGTPELISPANGVLVETINPQLEWESTPNTDYYRLQVATASSFNSNVIVFDDSTISNNTYQVGPLEYETEYFWRVRSRNSAGSSGWSVDWSFTTFTDTNVPSPPVLSLPLNGATGVSVNPSLSWKNSIKAAYYRLQVSTNTAFSDIITDQNNITSLSYSINGLAYNTTFYWRVNASNTSGTSNWSLVWNFTTVTEPDTPSAPNLVSPQNGSVDESDYPILTWDEVQNAETYHLQVAADESFTNIVFNIQSVPINYHQVGPLNLGTEYFWRVNARNAAGVSVWSEVWSFTTRSNQSTVPVMVSPADGSRNLPLSIICTWNGVQNAQSYRIQVSTIPDFSSLFFNDSSITNNSKQVTNLNSNTTYFWRVNARVNGQWGQYSAPWQFTTRVSSPSFINIDTTIFFPYHDNISDYKSSDYRVVGIPGVSHIPVINFLTGNIGSDWQVFWDNGSPDNYLIGYNQIEFIFSIGKAFWILKRGEMEITVTVEESPKNNKGNVEIPLHNGWNLITNPLSYSIPWDSVKILNGISEPIYAYEGSYRISQMLQPFTGFYFFNSEALSVLEIPVTSANKIKKENKFLSEYTGIDGWISNIKLTSDKYVDSIAWFGVSSLAYDNLIDLNFHKPRSWGMQPEIYFHRPEWDDNFPNYASDIRAVFNDLSEWTFEITAPAWKPLSLIFNPVDIPDHFEIYIFNSGTKRWADIRKNPVYEFTPASENTSFKIIVGRKNLIEDNLLINNPTEFKLGDNFPNPFNLSTTIPLTVPQKSDIEISVYNILGNKIKTLYKGSLSPGDHWFRWDGTDEKGNVNASGVYFYHISDNSNISIMKKMTLIK